MDPRVVQFAQNPWRTEPVLTIFWYVNFNFLLVSYYIFTLLKKKAGIEFEESRSKIYETYLRCFMKYFLRLCCPGNPEVPIEIRKPI